MKTVVVPITTENIHLVAALLNGHVPPINDQEPTFLICDNPEYEWEILSSHEFWMMKNTERGWKTKGIEIWEN